MGVLDGKVAIVTGAGKGIGRAESLALAKEGAAVVLAGRNREDVVNVGRFPLRRFGDPEKDIARVVVFLSGPDSGYMTGNTISVDGGVAMVV